MINNDEIPDNLKVARLTLISKNGKTAAALDEIRPIAILSHIIKVLEKAIKNKLETSMSKLLAIGKY